MAGVERSGFCIEVQDDGTALGQRHSEPAGTVGIAVGDLSAAGFKGMRDVFAPFGLGVVGAGGGGHPELSIGRGGEIETAESGARSDLLGEVVFCARIAAVSAW